MAIKEEDGAEGLILSGCSYIFPADDVGYKFVDLCDAHVAGMACDLSFVNIGIVMADELAHPFEVGFFGAGGVMAIPQGFFELFEEFLIFYGCHFPS